MLARRAEKSTCGTGKDLRPFSNPRRITTIAGEEVRMRASAGDGVVITGNRVGEPDQVCLVLVEESGRPIGIISARDVLGAYVASDDGPVDREGWPLGPRRTCTQTSRWRTNREARHGSEAG
jgi:hypothetical protein